LHDHCWKFLPPHSVFDLYRGAKKGFDLLEQGVTSLGDIPDDFKLTANQEIQKQVAISGKPYINKKAIAKFLAQLVKGGQKVQRVALQKCGTQWLVDTVVVGRCQGCVS
jgi:hypothetical protein